MLNFRNINCSPLDPVAKWNTEGVLTALQRGGIDDWKKIRREMKADESGVIRKNLDEAKACIQEGEIGFSVSRII